MHYLCSENKGADQLCSYCEADLRLCFRIGKYPVFMSRDSFNFHPQEVIMMLEQSTRDFQSLIDRSLKFRTSEEEKLSYPCSENKGADQLCCYCEADLRLCFRIGKYLVFMSRDSFNFHPQEVIMMLEQSTRDFQSLIDRSLKFRTSEEEKLSYPCSENKGADQLCSYCEADLRLCFRIGKYPVFMSRDSFNFRHQEVIMMLEQSTRDFQSLIDRSLKFRT